MSEEGGVLSGPEIKKALKYGVIEIDPFEAKNINPASIDLRLGDGVAVYENWVDCAADDHWNSFPRTVSSYGDGLFDGLGLASASTYIHDIKKSPPLRKFKMCKDKGWVLHPGILYLMHTLERIRLERVVAVIDGKSSLGRLGIQVHITAGYFDPGWDGQGTLEVTVVHPIRVYPGMRFCQMRFHTLCGDMLSYQETGRYIGQTAMGPVASKAHTQFQE